jgi:hypothetical protein
MNKFIILTTLALLATGLMADKCTVNVPANLSTPSDQPAPDAPASEPAK